MMNIFDRTIHSLTHPLLVIIAAIPLAACASADPFHPAAPGNIFGCDQARQLVISAADMSSRALIQFEGRTITLQRPENGANHIYTNNIFTLYLDDNLAFLEREGTPILTNCRPL